MNFRSLLRFGRSVTINFAIGLIGTLHCVSNVLADWPGHFGPTRDGHAASDSILPDSIGAVPKVVWHLEAGQGYAGASVDHEQAALFDRQGTKDVLRLVNLNDSSIIWKYEFDASYKNGIDADKGPRCVPQIFDDRVLVYSAAGELHCVDRRDGSRVWAKAIRNEEHADDGYFGAGSCPLVCNDVVIVNVGGKSNAGIVGLSLKDGSTVWSQTNAEASYSSPIEIDIDGRPYVVVPTRLVTFLIEPTNGKVLSQVPFGQRGPTVNAATPIVVDAGRVFLTASYGIGSLVLQPKRSQLEIVRKGEELASQYASPVSIGDLVFGSDGREDMGGATYKCIRASTGVAVWELPDMPICHSIVTGSGKDAKILLVGIDGRLWCIRASEIGPAMVWKTKLERGVYRALPALIQNKLLVRTSNSSKSEWLCIELSDTSNR